MLFSSKVWNLLILLVLTTKYVSCFFNKGKVLFNISSNLINRFVFLQGKLQLQISWKPWLKNITDIIFSPGTIGNIKLLQSLRLLFDILLFEILLLFCISNFNLFNFKFNFLIWLFKSLFLFL